MLNGLAGYIFGRRPGAGATDADEAIAAGRIVAADANANANANANEVDDKEEEDWILVNDERSVGDVDLITLPSSTESSGSASPVTTIEALGWNITPPPCFIASQQRSASKNRPAGTVDKKLLSTKGGRQGNDYDADDRQVEPTMEMSVFENLLIEHPSMSVYHGRPSKKVSPSKLPKPLKPQGPTTDISQAKQKSTTTPRATTMTATSKINAITVTIVDIKDDDELPALAVAEQGLNEINSISDVVVGHRNYVDFFHFFDGASLRYDVVRAATLAQQRVERAAKGKELGANRLRRKNRTAYDNSNNNGKPRKDRLKNFSGRSNDRKSQ